MVFVFFVFLVSLSVFSSRRRWSANLLKLWSAVPSQPRRGGGGVGLHLLTEYLIYFVLVTIFVLCGSREPGTSKTISYMS